MSRPRLVIDEAAALVCMVHLFRRHPYYQPKRTLAKVARELGLPVRTFQRWAKRTGFVARSRELATKQGGGFVR